MLFRVWYVKYGTEVACAGRLGGKSHGEGQLLSMGVHPDGRRVAVGTFHERAYLLQFSDVPTLPWEFQRSQSRAGERVSWASAPTIRCYSTDEDGEWVWDEEVEARNANSNASRKVVINMTHEEWLEWVEKEGVRDGVSQEGEEGNTNSNASRRMVIKLTHEEWLEWQRRGLAGTVAAGGSTDAGAEEGVLAVDGKFNVSGNNLIVA
jgi:hypothetical protein